MAQGRSSHGGRARPSEVAWRKGEYVAEILDGFTGTIQVDAYGGYTHLRKPFRKGGDPLRLAFCWARGRRNLIKANSKKG